MHEGSNLARQAERLLESDTPLDASQIATFDRLVGNLRTLWQQFSPSGSISDLPQCPAPLAAGSDILIVGSDRAFLRKLQTFARSRQMEPHLSASVTEARQFLTHLQPDTAIIQVDFESPDIATDSLEFLAHLSSTFPHLPVAVITSSNSLEHRLEIARQGGHLLLQAPVPADRVLDAVSHMLRPAAAHAKVLIVDDDPQFLAALQLQLAPWGFQIHTLSKAERFWEVLERCDPDLLLLDIAMPNINGLELCQVLRSDVKWQTLPVIVLSAHCDATTTERAYTVGADDVFSKPLPIATLAQRILLRLNRAQLTPPNLPSYP